MGLVVDNAENWAALIRLKNKKVSNEEKKIRHLHRHNGNEIILQTHAANLQLF